MYRNTGFPYRNISQYTFWRTVAPLVACLFQSVFSENRVYIQEEFDNYSASLNKPSLQQSMHTIEMVGSIPVTRKVSIIHKG